MATLVARRGRGPRLGVALSANALSASIRRAGQSRTETWRFPLSPLNGDGTSWPGLTEALRALAKDTGIADGRLTVALLPPLAEARGVELPPLGDAEIQQLLARSAGKYFVGARGAQVVGAVRASKTPGSATVSTVAATAGARLVNAIHASAAAAGWTLDAVIPAEAAWAAAAARWGPRKRGAVQLLVAHDDRTDLLRLEDGNLVGVRRFRAGDADAALIAEAFSSGAGHLAIVGNTETRRDLSRSLASRGVAVEAPPGTSPELSEHPELLAAAFATPAAAPALVTEAVRVARAANVRRVVTRIASVAALLVLAAGMLEWWGSRRELDAIRKQRAALASQISSTLVGRTTVENAFRQLEALVGEERAAPHWSTAIAAISERLPADAFLTGFRGRGDSVSVDGLAADAARVFGAIERVPVLSAVHSTGQVRMENPDDGPPLQRFAIAAQLVRPGAPKPGVVSPPRIPAVPSSPKGGAK